jgi:hypothetical protein
MASIMGGNYPGAGITLGPALTFGYRAGCHIANRNPEMRKSLIVLQCLNNWRSRLHPPILKYGASISNDARRY